MQEIIELSNLKDFEPFKGLKGKIVHTESQTYAFWELEEGAMLPMHQHIHEQVCFVTEGERELNIDGKTSLLKNGMIAIIPSNTNHSAKAITKVALTDVFTPIREDFPI